MDSSTISFCGTCSSPFGSMFSVDSILSTWNVNNEQNLPSTSSASYSSRPSRVSVFEALSTIYQVQENSHSEIGFDENVALCLDCAESLTFVYNSFKDFTSNIIKKESDVGQVLLKKENLDCDLFVLKPKSAAPQKKTGAVHGKYVHKIIISKAFCHFGTFFITGSVSGTDSSNEIEEIFPSNDEVDEDDDTVMINPDQDPNLQVAVNWMDNDDDVPLGNKNDSILELQRAVAYSDECI
jgi:hypothetical protein